MITISLVDEEELAAAFYPFALIRSVADLRCGIFTIREKWAFHSEAARQISAGLAIPCNVLPSPDLVTALQSDHDIIGIRNALQKAPVINSAPDLLRFNGSEIVADLARIKSLRSTARLSPTNRRTGHHEIFIEPGAQMEYAIINTNDGPVYIGKDALVMEGCLIRGPFAMGEGAVLKMGTRIYGPCSLGPGCVGGGEIKNSILMSWSNKAHDGFLGDSILGSWCNLGGGTSNSNLKNNVAPVKLWNPLLERFTDGGQKCGLMMGDYSRSAINTSFNTGTVVGASAHVFGSGLTPTSIPSFSWGFNPFSTYEFDKAVRDLHRWMAFKNKSPEDEIIRRLKTIFDAQKKSA